MPARSSKRKSAQGGWDVLVVGAGAAGLLAGVAAGRAGARTLVLEGQSRPGRKIAVTGGGRCNFTNTLSPREFVRRFGDRRAGRLGRALEAFGREDVVALLAAHGVGHRVEKEIRLVTRSGRAEDVVEALVTELAAAGAELRCETLVERVEVVGGDAAEGWFPFRTQAANGTTFPSRHVVICTGGMSWPATGSTGDGYRWARELGHKVTDLRPALVGLKVAEPWPVALQGLVCDDVELELRAGKRRLGRERGELLFTHFGISGPPVLDLSNAYVGADAERARLSVDFLPDRPAGVLADEVAHRLAAHPRRGPVRALEGLLPGRLLECLVELAGVGPATTCAELPRQARRRLPELLVATPLEVIGTRSIRHGEVTVGGISWDDIDPATMASRRIPGLYFAGEILDVAGRCGGFNLQAAFSTGWLAGTHSAADERGQTP